MGLGALADTLASIGPVLLGLALTVGLFYALARIGIGRWHDWDRRERRAMHPETPQLPDRSKAGAQAMLLLGGLLASRVRRVRLGTGGRDRDRAPERPPGSSCGPGGRSLRTGGRSARPRDHDCSMIGYIWR